jgi:hypothetical protein
MSIDYGCRFGMPHDPHKVGETKLAVYQKCVICRAQRTWVKDNKDRLLNKEYLKFNARAYAQRFGPTKGLFNKLYQPENCIIKI